MTFVYNKKVKKIKKNTKKQIDIAVKIFVDKSRNQKEVIIMVILFYD